MDINFKIEKDKLSSDITVPFSGNMNYYHCIFTFSDEWANLKKYAVFMVEDKAYTVEIIDNACIMPKEVLYKRCHVTAGVFGTNGASSDYIRISTNPICFFVNDGSYVDGETPEQPTPDIWEIYLQKVQNAANNVIPYIGSDDYWYVYDADKQSYAKTNILAKGQKGEKGDTGAKGDKGDKPVKGVDYFTSADIESLGIDQKQDKLTFDNWPTVFSDNPVTSGGVKTALDEKADKNDAVGKKTTAGGEIFNDYTNNVSSIYSHAEGYKTVAGQMGHLITDDGWGDSTSKTYTLTSIDGLAVNDTISMLPTGSITNNVADTTSYDIINDFAKITAIDITAKTITVNTYQSRMSMYGVIYVKSKPAVGTIAVAAYSHSEGGETKASGTYSHAEGNVTISSGIYSHTEGGGTNASARGAHAEGGGTTASGIYSHSEGSGTKASGHFSHAEGSGTIASGYRAHAEGQNTTANGDNSHTEGIGTKTYYPNQHVQGKYNTADPGGNYAHIVGNGKSDSERSNAHTLDWNGNAWFAGNIKVGGTYNSVAGIVGAKTLATIDDVRPNIRLIIEDTVIVNTIYDLAVQTALTITLPSGQIGDFIEVDFISGETATTLILNSSSGLVGFDLIPGTNTIYTLYFDWGAAGYDGTSITYGWRCNYSEYSIDV